MTSDNEGEIRRQHELEQTEAKFEELGCTVLPPGIDPTHTAFMEILKAVILSDTPLTQEQLAAIIDAKEGE